jgi:hypothetical protein
VKSNDVANVRDEIIYNFVKKQRKKEEPKYNIHSNNDNEDTPSTQKVIR